jgi:hypothetical protein
MIKKTRSKIQDKKKLCPNCNRKVFNATITCKHSINNKICNHHFISKRVGNLQADDNIKNNIKNKVLIDYIDVKLLFPYQVKTVQCIIPPKLLIKLNF